MTLDLALAGDVLANAVPVCRAQLGDQLGQQRVLYGLGSVCLPGRPSIRRDTWGGA